jgi:hypothetical protein
MELCALTPITRVGVQFAMRSKHDSDGHSYRTRQRYKMVIYEANKPRE